MNIRTTISKTVSTFFYVGYLPFIPGTFGSLCGLFLFYFWRGNLAYYFLLVALAISAGFLTAGRTERAIGRKDPSCVVIDEVGGILLSFLSIPHDIKLIVIGFFLFRLLDTLKPYPADRLQDLKGSAGIMFDDVVAGLYTNCILQVVLRFTSCRIS